MTSSSQRRNLLRAVCYSLLFYFVAHAYICLNPLFSGGSLMISMNQHRADLTVGGRYLLPIYGRLRGDLAAPLTVGLLSAVCLSCAIALTLCLLGIRGKLAVPLACGLLMVNAAVTGENLTEFYAADGASLALLLVALAVCAGMHSRRGILPGAALSFFAFALDKNAFAVGCTLAVGCALTARPDAKGEALRAAARAAIALLLGALLQAAALPLFLSRAGLTREPGAYAISSLRAFSSPRALLGALACPLLKLLRPDTIHPLFCGVVTALLLGGGLLSLFCPSDGVSVRRRLLRVALLPLLLLAANPNGFAFGDVPARSTWAFDLLPVIALALIAQRIPAASSHRRFRAVAAALCLMQVVCGALFSNQLYLKRHLEAQSTLSLMTRVVALAERTPGFEPGVTPVALVGDPNEGVLSVTRTGFEHLASFDGDNYAVSSEQDALWYTWTVLGYPFNFVSDYERGLLSEDPRVAALACFPNPDCSLTVGGTLVIRLGPSSP